MGMEEILEQPVYRNEIIPLAKSDSFLILISEFDGSQLFQYDG